MENRYFHPYIEDIHVGYECEIYENEQYVSYVIPHIIVGGNTRIDIPCGSHWSIQNKLRVPYLNREQIEAEGWEFVKQQDDYNQEYSKTINDFSYTFYYYQSYNTKEQKIAIYINYKTEISPEVLVKGILCKDINTFRLIQKLLGI